MAGSRSAAGQSDRPPMLLRWALAVAVVATVVMLGRVGCGAKSWASESPDGSWAASVREPGGLQQIVWFYSGGRVAALPLTQVLLTHRKSSASWVVYSWANRDPDDNVGPVRVLWRDDNRVRVVVESACGATHGDLVLELRVAPDGALPELIEARCCGRPQDRDFYAPRPLEASGCVSGRP